jgi:hypothetical protein
MSFRQGWPGLGPVSCRLGHHGHIGDAATGLYWNWVVISFILDFPVALQCAIFILVNDSFKHCLMCVQHQIYCFVANNLLEKIPYLGSKDDMVPYLAPEDKIFSI